MDVVKFLGEEPFVFCVVDFKRKIRGYAESFLDGGGKEKEGWGQTILVELVE